MNTRLMAIGIALWGIFILSSAFSAPNRVRVVNETNETIYIHKGMFAPSVNIKPGKWKIFYYPFYVVPPNSTKKIASTVIAATAGGRWITTPNGLTYLSKPKMVICLDYGMAEHQSKAGNRVWTIKRAQGFDKNCKIQPYKQPWYQNQSQ